MVELVLGEQMSKWATQKILTVTTENLTGMDKKKEVDVGEKSLQMFT